MRDSCLADNKWSGIMNRANSSGSKSHATKFVQTLTHHYIFALCIHCGQMLAVPARLSAVKLDITATLADPQVDNY